MQVQKVNVSSLVNTQFRFSSCNSVLVNQPEDIVPAANTFFKDRPHRLAIGLPFDFFLPTNNTAPLFLTALVKKLDPGKVGLISHAGSIAFIAGKSQVPFNQVFKQTKWMPIVPVGPLDIPPHFLAAKLKNFDHLAKAQALVAQTLIVLDNGDVSVIHDVLEAVNQGKKVLFLNTNPTSPSFNAGTLADNFARKRCAFNPIPQRSQGLGAAPKLLGVLDTANATPTNDDYYNNPNVKVITIKDRKQLKSAVDEAAEFILKA